MTQFAIVRLDVAASEKLGRHLRMLYDGSLMVKASNSIFGGKVHCYELMPNGRSFDDLYLSAQRELQSKAYIELFSALNELRANVVELALWYGDDFLDLPVVSKWEKFSSVLAQDIEALALETYLHYRPELDTSLRLRPR